MSTLTFFVQPQAAEGGTGWHAVPEHRAKRWQVMAEQHKVVQGKRIRITHRYGVHASKKAAYEELHKRQRLDSSTLSRLATAARQLGARWPAAPGRKIIAQSLTTEQYLQQRHKDK